MLTAGQVRDTIRSVLCKNLSVEQADELARALTPGEVRAGDLILHEGDSPSGLFLLLRGAVEILKKTPHGQTHSLGTIDAPTVVGEMGLITERPHTATVRAASDCDFYLLSKTQFQRLLAGESIAAYKLVATIAEVLAGRLARLDQKVVELEGGHAAVGHVEELAAFKQKLFSEWGF